MTDIMTPSLGESVTEATVARWAKRSGETVARDELVVELETDKVLLEVVALSPLKGPSLTAFRASVKTISTWVEVSSPDTMSAIHLRDTRSSMMVTAMPQRVKWVVS